jgi:hypothetical protein
MLTLLGLSQRVRQIYDRAAHDPDLGGRPLLEMCADLIPGASRAHLVTAIFASGIDVICNDHIRSEIDNYWRSANAPR